MLWLVEHSFAFDDSATMQSGTVLTGTPACAGSYTGPARVIRTEAEFGKLSPENVLVCPTTSPVWSVLFASVGAMVSDAGGSLSPAAITTITVSTRPAANCRLAVIDNQTPFPTSRPTSYGARASLAQ